MDVLITLGSGVCFATVVYVGSHIGSHLIDEKLRRGASASSANQTVIVSPGSNARSIEDAERTS